MQHIFRAATLVSFVVFSSLAVRAGVVQDLVSKAAEAASCEDFSTKWNNRIAQPLIDGQEIPTAEEVRAELQTQIGEGTLATQLAELYRLIAEESRSTLNASSKEEMLEVVMGLEVGDASSEARADLKARVNALYAMVRASAQAEGRKCVLSEEERRASKVEVPQVVAANAVAQGAVKALATAYQSCQAKIIPAMNASSSSVEGISIIGTHPDGVGKKRVIGNLAQVRQSHYYVREGIEKDPSCFNVGNSPLIYDYGGKPYATTAVDSPLDFFKNAGSGTAVLGVDCSGYVFSALAASGLRVSPGKRLTASQVYGISARMYMNPADNGLSCLAPVPSTKDKPLADGDILASTGHVVVIDRVGSDPFGVNRLSSASQCTAANISYRNFDFDVLQSSPVKGGIGLDRMRASAYFGESASMQAALVQYAVAACKARFGAPSTIKPAQGRLVRHKLTSECLDRVVPLARESCVQSCF